MPVLSTDVDERFEIRPDGIARYLQEVGFAHLKAAGASESHPHWIARRTIIDMVRPLRWPDDIRARRWCSGISPRWMNMRIRLDGSDGGLIETEAFWIHMNKDTMMPSRVSDAFFAQMATTTSDHRLKWRTWLPEKVADDPSVTFPLRRVDIDHFQHVTNSVYWQAISEVAAKVPDITAGRHRLVIEYDKPIKYGEEVRIHTRPGDDCLHIWFAVDADVRARAQIRRRDG